MEEYGQYIGYAVVIVTAILGAIWGILKVKLQSTINEKVKDDRVREVLDFLLDRADTVVTGLQQELADDLKKAAEDGKLTDEEKDELKHKAIDLLINSLTPSQAKLLETLNPTTGVLQDSNIVNAVEGIVGNLVETAIKNRKEFSNVGNNN